MEREFAIGCGEVVAADAAGVGSGGWGGGASPGGGHSKKEGRENAYWMST